MGYILIQTDNSKTSKLAFVELLNTGDCDIYLAQTGAHLQPIVYSSRTAQK